MRDPLARVTAPTPDDLDRLMRAAFKLLEVDHGSVELDATIGRALGFTTRIYDQRGQWHAGVRLNTGRVNWQPLPLWTTYLPCCTDFEAAALDWAEHQGFEIDALQVSRAGCGLWSVRLGVAARATTPRIVEGRCVGAYTEPLARMAATLNLVAKVLGWAPHTPAEAIRWPTTVAAAS